MEAPSLYNHIENKEKVLEELLLEIAEQFTSGMKTITNANLSALDQLKRIVALHVNLTINNPDAISLIINEWVHLSEIPRATYTSLRDSYEKDFKKIIRRGIKEGDLKTVNVDIATFSILSTLRWLYSWYGKNRAVNAITLEENITQCLIEGLRN